MAPVIQGPIREGVYAPLGFPPAHQPSSGAIQALIDDLRAHYGSLGNVVPVITWRMHPLVLRLYGGLPRHLDHSYLFVTPLVGPLLDLVWYVQGVVPGDHPDWELSNGSYYIYHKALERFR
ncbi:hypothetical protein FF47_56 [Mycobacterium phage FF47]|uniref:Uncharacterized protein n=2 Tax=Mapvirus Ff47 TaxID=1920751 RepID=A0A899INE0_9CAUD|nr:hypothetical protein FF47_56 [Mycobacterium phage FF47]AGI12328.1 hypothetical protein FF47_56 [Mycobacterium phage FF47]QSL99594.1 hypothetical protein [Mycobacterium phage Maco2]WKV22129.1 hypothetical protein 8UZL_00011 [Mycobacteroides phage 8UZL]